MNLKSSLILILFLTSCGSLIKQGPARAKAERFYKLTNKKGIIYHRTCENIKKKNRKCVISEIDLIKEWEYFEASFILIPFRYVFP